MTENQLPSPDTTTLRQYLFFFGGQSISLLGSTIVRFVLIWWITITTQSAVFLALATMAEGLPRFFTYPIAGVYVDRWNRKTTILVADSLQALISIFFFLLFLSGSPSIWIVFVLLAVASTVSGFQFPAVQAIIPLMVPKSRLSRINGMLFLINGIVFAIGPILGAVLYGLWEISSIMLIDTVTFLMALVPLALITVPSLVRTRSLSFRKDFSAGFSIIWRTPGLISLLSVFLLINFLITPIFSILPYIVEFIHLGNASNLAVLFLVLQIGGLLGGGLMSFWKGFADNLTGVVVGLIIMTIGLMIISIAPLGAYTILAIGIFAMGFALPIANVSSQTIWQTAIPPEYIGRVFGTRRTLAQAARPFGVLIIAFFVEISGIVVFLVTSIIYLGILGIIYSMRLKSVSFDQIVEKVQLAD